MIRSEFLEVSLVRMDVEPVYKILDNITAAGTKAIYHSRVVDDDTVVNANLLREWIRIKEKSFDDGDTITDGTGYICVKNGKWTDYKLLPLHRGCANCKYETTEDDD